MSFMYFLKPRISLAKVLSWDDKRDFFFPTVNIKDLLTELKVKVEVKTKYLASQAIVFRELSRGMIQVHASF